MRGRQNLLCDIDERQEKILTEESWNAMLCCAYVHISELFFA